MSKSTIKITVKMLDAKGACKDITVQRVVKPYGSSDHYVNYRGQIIIVKQYRGSDTWYGTTVNYWF
jgi:hypothetical protein